MPQELFQELIDRLAALRRKSERLALVIGITRGAAVSVAALFLALVLEAIFHFGIAGRTILFWSVLIIALGVPVALVSDTLMQRLGIKPRIADDTLAYRIGKHFRHVEDKLVNVLQLARELASAPESSRSFAAAAFSGTYGSVRDLDFSEILDERPRRRSMILLLLSLIISGGSFVGFSDDLGAAGKRLIDHNTFYQKPAPFTFIVRPGNTRLLRGETASITVRTDGEQLNSLALYLREEGASAFQRIELTPVAVADSTGRKNMFGYEFRLNASTEYYAEARGIESERFTISALDRPIIRSLSVTVQPPAYTRQPSTTLDENLGDVSALVGTRLSVNVTSSKPLLQAVYVFTPEVVLASADSSDHSEVKSERIPLSIDGTNASGTIILRKSGSYHIELTDIDSLTGQRPIEYTVTLTQDEMPAVALLDPAERADIPGNMRLPMLVKIHDDFGFSRLRLGYRLRSSKYAPEEKEYKWFDLPMSEYHTQDAEVPYMWNLSQLDISPEDELGYVIEVADNDNVSGPKVTRTYEFTLRFPSVDEIFKKAEARSDEAERSLREIRNDAEELKRKVDETVNEMRQSKPNEISRKQQEFSNKKDIEEIKKRQEELNARLEQVKDNLDKMTKDLQSQNAISPETMQKYQELQKLLNEVRTPELENAFRKLDMAMRNMDPKALQEAMKEVQFNEEQFKKSIERTANILKKIKMEQKLDEMLKRTNELAKNQDEAAKQQDDAASGKKPLSPEDKAKAERKQQDAKNELNRLQEEAKDLAREMQKLPESMQAPDEMKQAMEAANDPSMEKSMQDAQEAMKQGQNKRAGQRQRDAAEKLRQARNKMQQLKQKLQESEREQTMNELRRIKDEVTQLSKREETLKRHSQNAPPSSNIFRDLAAEQSERKDELGNTASRMMQLAQKSMAVTPEMGKAMGQAYQRMMQAQDAMTERDQQSSIAHTQAAMAALNKAAQETESALEQMKQSSSCPNGDGSNPGQGQPGGSDPFGSGTGKSAMQSFLDQLNKLSESQMAMNEQLRQMAQQGSAAGQRQMLERQAEAARIAAGQEAARKSLEDLAREQQQAGSSNKKAADDLKKIAEEMQELVSDMRSKGVRPETVKRQERILSRLLEAQRSMNERDKEETREARPGENMARQTPGALDLSKEDAKRLLTDELRRSRENGFTKDYQILIRKYLEELQK
jgi:hypothetical protein